MLAEYRLVRQHANDRFVNRRRQLFIDGKALTRSTRVRRQIVARAICMTNALNPAVCCQTFCVPTILKMRRKQLFLWSALQLACA